MGLWVGWRITVAAQWCRCKSDVAPGGHGERRRHCRLTDFGLRVLQAEIRRLEKPLALVQRKKLAGRSGAATADVLGSRRDACASVPGMGMN